MACLPARPRPTYTHHLFSQDVTPEYRVTVSIAKLQYDAPSDHASAPPDWQLFPSGRCPEWRYAADVSCGGDYSNKIIDPSRQGRAYLFIYMHNYSRSAVSAHSDFLSVAQL